MRIVLISTLTLFCAAPIFAQNPAPEPQPQAPSAIAAKEQAASPAGSSVTSTTSLAVKIAPDAPVVTLEGVCNPIKEPGTKGCQTVITQADISNMVEALTPGALPDVRRRFAIRYAQLLAASSEAQRKHLDADPAVATELRAQMELARVQVLSNAFYRQIKENSANVPVSEIQKYYLDHKTDFDQGEVRRLTIPTAYTVGDELPARAAKGEDFDQLQLEIYKNAGIEAAPPTTRLGLIQRTALSADEAKVFDLKVGEIAQMQDANGGSEILKLESKHSVPIEIVQPNITTILQKERMEKELKSAAADVTANFNLDYLGMAYAPELFPPPVPGRPTVPKGVGPADSRSRGLFRQGMPSRSPRVRVLPQR